jgi:hypothetical protein
MKLQTTIAPRRDGTVIVRGHKGQEFKFTPDEHEELTCDVADEMLVAKLLASGNFFPADESDFAVATALVQSAVEPPVEPDEPDDDHGEVDDLPDDTGDLNALPIEGEAAEDGAAADEASSAPAAQPSRRRQRAA